MATLIWITGLAGSGKSTLAKEVYAQLKAQHSNSVLLDGDHFREIIGNDLGYDNESRLINAWRIARMCRFLCGQEIHVVCATMSLYKEIHSFNRSNTSGYLEVFMDTNMDELISRDQKNLYSRALKGELKNVIGVDLDFDRPIHAELILKNLQMEDIMLRATEILETCSLI
ncbi:MAG: adenylyl-sulfate kinase [Bacteroidota bacterium]